MNEGKNILLDFTIGKKAMKIKNISDFHYGSSEKTFGLTPDGQNVIEYILTNKNGMKLSAVSYGAAVTSLVVPTKDGRMVDVVLGFDNQQAYSDSYDLPSAPYFGATVGRYAGRIANAEFRLNGRKILLDENNSGNCLHGGFHGFSQKIWQVKKVQGGPNPSVTFSLISADGDANFPGKLTVEMTYTLTEENEFAIDYKAFTSEDTIVNLTHHSYFNLDGHSGDVRSQLLSVNASKFLETNADNIPSGRFLETTGEMDFSDPKNCPESIDNTFVLDGQYGQAATLFSDKTRLKMTVFTNQPGLHIYVGGNCFNRIKGKEMADYHRHSGICFETQNFPDAPNHANFPDAVLKKDSIYYHKTIYKFQSL